MTNMQLLSLNFFLYTVCGLWRPVKWSSQYAKLLYNMYTFYTLVPLHFLVLGQFLDLILIFDSFEASMINSLMFATLISVCCKAISVVIRRDAIFNLTQMLSNEPCKPRDADEIAIQSKFDEFIRSFTIKYTILALGSYTSFEMKAVLGIMQGITPHRVWVPYDISNLSLSFYITCVQQIVSMLYATIINIGTETFVFGLFLQTCAQLEIFEKRVHKMVINNTTRLSGEHREHHSITSANYKENTISGHIRHHIIIYKYAKSVNTIFNQVLFIQFFISIYILCVSVFYLSSHITEPEAAFMVVYTICMFVQIYMYCWSGNEVILKSSKTADAMYQTDWPTLSINEKRNLLMIMKCSALPIKFTSSFLITLSLDSFGSILKTSYSAFSVLQQRS